jgi:hypothetical protein
VTLRIEDTGDDFDLNKVKGKGGLGLISMEERVRLVNGKFTIQFQPGKGTTVEVFVPLASAKGPEGARLARVTRSAKRPEGGPSCACHQTRKGCGHGPFRASLFRQEKKTEPAASGPLPVDHLHARDSVRKVGAKILGHCCIGDRPTRYRLPAIRSPRSFGAGREPGCAEPSLALFLA